MNVDEILGVLEDGIKTGREPIRENDETGWNGLLSSNLRYFEMGLLRLCN